MTIASPFAADFGQPFARGFDAARGRIPVLELDFANDIYKEYGDENDLANIWTFTRSTPAWSWDRNPLLNKYASGVARRPVYDPDTLKSLGLLAEAQRTNSLLDNRDLSTANWTNSATINQNQTGADGVANKAWTVEDDNNSGFETADQDVTITDNSNTHVVYTLLKKEDDESTFPEFEVRFTGGTTTLRHTVQLNRKTGAKFDRETDGTSVVRDAGDWWIVEISMANNGTGNTNLSHLYRPAVTDTLDGTTDSSLTGHMIVDFGGVRLNASTFGSPIETGSSAVTVNADDASMTLPSELASGFVWVIHARMPPVIPSVEATLGSLDKAGTLGNFIAIRLNSKGAMSVNVRTDSSSVVDMSVGSFSPGEDVKVAFRAQEDDYVLFANGSGVSDTAGAFPNGLANKRIGIRTGDVNLLNSTIALDKMYANPGDWSDADLQEASS